MTRPHPRYLRTLPLAFAAFVVNAMAQAPDPQAADAEE